jgi:hypothetical protein
MMTSSSPALFSELLVVSLFALIEVLKELAGDR